MSTETNKEKNQNWIDEMYLFAQTYYEPNEPWAMSIKFQNVYPQILWTASRFTNAVIKYDPKR